MLRLILNTLDEARGLVEERDSGLGTGGMNSKLEAAMICQRENTETWIVNGGVPNFMVSALAGKIPYTKFTTS